MPVICPTVLASEPHHFREQLERVTLFADRIHFDLMDGEFASPKSINPVQLHWPDNCQADIHIMYKRPLEQLETLIALKPNTIIFHAEAEGDLLAAINHLHAFGIKAGTALLAGTAVANYSQLIGAANYVLVFSGHLGHFGGQADLGLLGKVNEIKQLNPEAEIGWDGGVNRDNVAQLVAGGIDVVNVGGAIQRAADPHASYDELVAAAVA